ncbi:uncharacterized protein L3040_008144 [Drepanopeziza brunnea f. sp. 'multigermtubi']|uniref:Uncharacterized protein n=1 Tax=Marssonina brunnea f. sp. multigermtubi (strain MB_m1) TaxID=1072389 RepID=K1Y196_MARBU|nr:uncharacterized protein MBM_03166 [Drepanopeziza brunnea f. sp. 'multigermtubi' MB_m1]EKD18924.1 hypothetical protein MBM_03166 [Drepanopeziza brunnea f. sp. 'multigermtubi' MB_m1]KAJ5034876.1 hypothetical protein L3040_008144 [Drepanopeziza brunnea f. sp. 'multigermtubi']
MAPHKRKSSAAAQPAAHAKKLLRGHVESRGFSGGDDRVPSVVTPSGDEEGTHEQGKGDGKGKNKGKGKEAERVPTPLAADARIGSARALHARTTRGAPDADSATPATNRYPAGNDSDVDDMEGGRDLGGGAGAGAVGDVEDSNPDDGSDSESDNQDEGYYPQYDIPGRGTRLCGAPTRAGGTCKNRVRSNGRAPFGCHIATHRDYRPQGTELPGAASGDGTDSESSHSSDGGDVGTAGRAGGGSDGGDDN